MPLDSMIDYIINASLDEKYNVIKEARTKATELLSDAEEEARKLYEAIIEKERLAAKAEKQRLIVNARLESKKKILKAKQDLIDLVFNKVAASFTEDILKKEQITQSKVQESSLGAASYLEKIRFDYEIEVAKILFG